MTTMNLKTGRGTTIQATKDRGYWVIVEFDANWNKIARHGEHVYTRDAKIAMVKASLSS